MTSQIFQTSLQDVAQSARRMHLILNLAYESLRHRYRRTALGLLWTGLSFLMFLGIFVLIFGYIRGFRGEALAQYAMHVGYGWVAWGFLSAMVTGGASCFSRNANWVKGTNLPYSIYILTDVVEQGFVSFVCFAIMIVLTIALGFSLNWNALFVILGFFLCVFNAFWIGLFLAVISSRLRDLQHFLMSFMRAFFFTTPIIWTYEQASGLRKALAIYNPFTHFIEMIRKPMLGEVPGLLNWTVVGSVTIVAPILALLLFGVWKNRIPLWV